MNALILTASGFEDLELLVPYYRLLEANLNVDIAAPDQGKVAGKHGMLTHAGKTLDEVSADDYDLLLLPGGMGPETVRLNENALKVTRAFMEAGKPVACICHGAQILISAGVIEGHDVTCWKGIKDDVIAAGGKYHDQEVVICENLVTSRQPSDLHAFCREMISKLDEWHASEAA